MNVHTPYTSSLGPCWEAAWKLGVMVGGDGGEDRQVLIGLLLKQTNSGRLLRGGFSGHAPVVNMVASILREI